ncbi:MAG: hypothetical protein K2J33_04970, partial [Alistipes sp.]|nr:hypothetical protein [Alistipes sp.]
GNLFGMFVVGYILSWIAVPVARSARQKLEMNGEAITARSIRETTVESSDADSAAKPVVANVVTVFGQIVLILLKIFAGLIVFGLILSACALIVGIIVVSIRGYGDVFNGQESALVSCLGISVALVPVMMLIYVLMCLIASRKPGAKSILVMFMLWLIAIVACAVTAAYELRGESIIGGRGLKEHLLTRTNVVIDGDTVQAERMIRENIEEGRPGDADVVYDKKSSKFSVSKAE